MLMAFKFSSIIDAANPPRADRPIDHRTLESKTTIENLAPDVLGLIFACLNDDPKGQTRDFDKLLKIPRRTHKTRE